MTTVILPRAMGEFYKIQLSQFKSVVDYNTKLMNTVQRLKYCKREDMITNKLLIQQTFTTIPRITYSNYQRTEIWNSTSIVIFTHKRMQMGRKIYWSSKITAPGKSTTQSTKKSLEKRKRITAKSAVTHNRIKTINVKMKSVLATDVEQRDTLQTSAELTQTLSQSSRGHAKRKK